MVSFNQKGSAQAIFEGVHCSLSVEHPAPSIVVVRLTGWDVGEWGDVPFQEITKEILREDCIELYIDARGGKGASLDVTSAWAQWLGKHRSHFKHVTLLTGSKFIQLSADFVRRFAELGDVMRIYTDPRAFDEALEESITQTNK